jgi:hypothetical protein
MACVAGCSREQQDWRAAEGADTMDSYGRFIERHPDSELVKGARTRIAQLAEDRDWSEAGKADTAAAYQQFLARHPDGKWAQQARIRAQNFALTAGGANASLGIQAASTGQASPAAAESAASTPVPQPTKDFGIQLGAFSSEDRANTEWRALADRFPGELKGLSPQIIAADTASGRVFRLQAPAGDEVRARLLCEQLRKGSQPCVLVVPH